MALRKLYMTELTGGTWDLAYSDGRQVSGFFSSKEQLEQYVERKFGKVNLIEEKLPVD